MTMQEMLQHVDHTQLKAFATWESIQVLCEEAIKYQTASVCIPQTYVERVHKEYGDRINICTVVGFPLGYQVTNSKILEAKESIENGANEIDMVINISDVKNGNFVKVEEEIKSMKAACGNHILKVIIETCYLTKEEKIAMCKAVTNAGADYIKTSTGFGTDGATMEDVILMKKNIGAIVKVKAAGGVKTLQDLEDFIKIGCDRIGTSSAISLVEGESTTGY
ncbi:MAG: deoxyribose-phosphate aldolase [Eubacteriales bacterium]